MAKQVASLYGVLSLDDSGFTSGLASAQKTAGGFGDSLTQLGIKVGTLGNSLTTLTAPLVAFGVQGLETATLFDSSMAEISARTGLVGDDLEEVRQAALKMGADTAFSALQASDAFLELLSSGQSAGEALKTLPVVLTAAAASGEQLGTMADAVTDIMAMFQLPVEDVSEDIWKLGERFGVTEQMVVDYGNNMMEATPQMKAFAGTLGLTLDQLSAMVNVEDAADVVESLARAAGASSASMGSLAQGFANVGGIANSFGLSVNETAATLAIFAENGIKGAEAGTQLKSMLLNMSRTTEETQGTWEMLGVSLYDAEGNVRNLDTVIAELDTALDKLPVEEQNDAMMKLAGSYGITGLTALRNSISIAEMEERMTEQSSAADIAAARMNTFAGKTDSLSGSIETFHINVMTPFMNDILGPLVVGLTGAVNGFTAWAAANPDLAKGVIILVGAIAGLGAVLTVAGTAMVAIGTAMSVAAPAVAAVSAGMAMATAATGTLAAGTWALLGPIGLIIIAIAALAAAYFTNFGGIKDFIDGTVRPILDRFFQGLAMAWELVKPGLEALKAWFDTALTNITTIIVSASTAAETLIAGLSGLWTGVKGGVEAFANGIMSALAPVIEFIGGIAGAIQDVIDALSGVQTTVSAGGSPIAPPGYGGPRASGGPVMGGTPYLVGEEGPELFIPGSSGRIMNNSDTEGMMGSGGVNVSIGAIYANDAAGGRAAADAFGARLREQLASK